MLLKISYVSVITFIDQCGWNKTHLIKYKRCWAHHLSAHIGAFPSQVLDISNLQDMRGLVWLGMMQVCTIVTLYIEKWIRYVTLFYTA